MSETRMTKREKWAVQLAVSALSYLRGIVVFASIVAFTDHAWGALFLSWAVFGATTWALSKTMDTPSDETMMELNAALAALASTQEET